MMSPGFQRKPGAPPRPTAGSWRVDQAQSQAVFAARVAGRPVRGRLSLTGRVLIADRIEDSTAQLAARSSQVSTGYPVLDRRLMGPSLLDAAAFPEISFQSEVLAWAPPAGGRSAACRSRAPSTNWTASSMWTVTAIRSMTRPPSVSPATGSSTRGG